MPGFIGKKLCPELVIVPTNFEKYTSISKQVKAIIADYDPNYCPMSLDEAYLNITEHMQKRKLFSVEERTYLCRDSSYAHSRAHCLCDLNEVLRHHGSEVSSLVAKNSSNFETENGNRKYSNTDMSLEKRIKAENDDNVCKKDLEEPENKLNCVGASIGKTATGICPQCEKELPPFEVKTFGLSDEDIVHELRARTEQKTRLTASAGSILLIFLIHNLGWISNSVNPNIC